MPTGPPIPPRPRVLLVDPDLRRLAYLRQALEPAFEVVGDAGNGADAARMALEFVPDLVVLTESDPTVDSYQAIQVLTDRAVPPVVIVLCDRGGVDAATLALRAGARAFEPTEIGGPELLVLAAGLLAQERARRDPALRLLPRLDTGIWTFCSASGSVGRTSLLLAVADRLLAKHRRVVVVDLDLFFGECGYLLGLPSSPPDLAGLLATERYLEGPVLQRHLDHHGSGLRVLKAPSEPEGSLDLDPRPVAEVVRGLSNLFDHVLVDLPVGHLVRFIEVACASGAFIPVGSSDPSRIKDLSLLVRNFETDPRLAGIPRFPVVTRVDQTPELEGLLRQHGWNWFLLPPYEAAGPRRPGPGHEPEDARFTRAVGVMVDDMLARLARDEKPGEPPRNGVAK